EEGKRRNEEIERNDSLPVIDGELLDVSSAAGSGSGSGQIEFADAEEEETVVPGVQRQINSATVPRASRKPQLTKIEVPLVTGKEKAAAASRKALLQYLVLPAIFLTVTLFGGLRFGEADNAFLFLKPPLVCLIFAAILLVLFFRAGLIQIEGWFSEGFSTVKNIANGLILLTLFTASMQVFNSLLPERGLPFLIMAFCFFWMLCVNLFAIFNQKKLLQSLMALFAIAFLTKYLILANLAAPTAESWWQGILQNPTQEVFTWLLDLPKFSPATGYIQFFTLIFYLIGLFLIKPETNK
ncbi:MAG: hypothetical protein M3384_16680, partial [Acidobacteriota bacterium]|nr:hypothetical protein [Acidobacteriota bacterium]